MRQTPDGLASFFDQDTWYGKMYQERSAQTKEATSRQSSKKPSVSQSRKPPVLKLLKRDGLPGGDTATWTDDGAFIGEFSTRNTSECPSVAVESRLSQILEAFLLTPPRGGRRKEWVDMVDYIHISTHAPAWGATRWVAAPDSL